MTAEWPGGFDTQDNGSWWCSVTVYRPNWLVTLVGKLGTPWGVVGLNGYSSCFGIHGEDGDGVFTPDCSDLTGSVGSVQDGTPSCSNGLCTGCTPPNNVAHSTYMVQCIH